MGKTPVPKNKECLLPLPPSMSRLYHKHQWLTVVVRPMPEFHFQERDNDPYFPCQKTRMRSHSNGSETWSFLYFSIVCEQREKTLARQCGCKDSTEPSLFRICDKYPFLRGWFIIGNEFYPILFYSILFYVEPRIEVTNNLCCIGTRHLPTFA